MTYHINKPQDFNNISPSTDHITIHLSPNHLPDIPNIQNTPTVPHRSLFTITITGKIEGQISLTNLTHLSPTKLIFTSKIYSNSIPFHQIPETVTSLSYHSILPPNTDIPKTIKHLTVNGVISWELNQNLEYISTSQISNKDKFLLFPNLKVLSITSINALNLPYIKSLKYLGVVKLEDLSPCYYNTLEHIVCKVGSQDSDLTRFKNLKTAAITYDNARINSTIKFPESLTRLILKGKVSFKAALPANLIHFNSRYIEFDKLPESIETYTGRYFGNVFPNLNKLRQANLLFTDTESRVIRFDDTFSDSLETLQLSILSLKFHGLKIFSMFKSKNLKKLTICADKGCKIFVKKFPAKLTELYVREVRKLPDYYCEVLKLDGCVLPVGLKKCGIQNNLYFGDNEYPNLEKLYVDTLYADKWDYKKFPMLKKLFVFNTVKYFDDGIGVMGRVISENLEVFSTIEDECDIVSNIIKGYKEGDKLKLVVSRFSEDVLKLIESENGKMFKDNVICIPCDDDHWMDGDVFEALVNKILVRPDEMIDNGRDVGLGVRGLSELIGEMDI